MSHEWEQLHSLFQQETSDSQRGPAETLCTTGKFQKLKTNWKPVLPGKRSSRLRNCLDPWGIISLQLHPEQVRGRGSSTNRTTYQRRTTEEDNRHAGHSGNGIHLGDQAMDRRTSRLALFSWLSSCRVLTEMAAKHSRPVHGQRAAQARRQRRHTPVR